MRRFQNNKIVYCVVMLLFVTTACEQFQGIEYSDEPTLNFTINTDLNTGARKDSLTHSFFMNPPNPDLEIIDGKEYQTIYIDIFTMGILSSENRLVSFYQQNEGQADAAIAGIHYIPFDDERVKNKMFIPAGANKASVPVVLINDESLQTQTVRLVLGINPNEYFSGGVTELSQFKLRVTAMASKPSIWDNYWADSFGRSWGTEKMRFLINSTGYTDWEERVKDSYLLLYMKRINQKRFEEEHPADNPLLEADGTVVSFTN